MRQFEKSIWIIFIIILLISAVTLSLLYLNYKKVNRVFTSDLHELYQHTLKLNLDNNEFRKQLHNIQFHTETDHKEELVESLDRIYLRLSLIKNLALSIPLEHSLMEYYPILREQLDSISELIRHSFPQDREHFVHEIEIQFDTYDKKAWEIIIATDRLVKISDEESMRLLRTNEIRVIVASALLFPLVLALFIIAGRYRINLKQLKMNEEKLSVVLDSMRAEVLSIDSDFRVITQNKKASEGLGRDALGMDLYELFPDLPFDREEIADSIAEGAPLQKEFNTGLRKDEQYEIMIYPLSGSDTPGAVVIIADRSEQSRMKDLIAQNEKMLSVGGLAAGMAHEINNPLAGMIQTAAVIRSRLTDRNLKGNLRAAEDCGLDMAALKAYLEKRHINNLFDGMAESGEQASAIVGNMLDFVQRDSTAVSTHDFVKLVNRSLELAATDYDMKSYLYFDKIEIIREFDKDLPLIPCSGSRIQQVVLNILRNGAEAMVIPHEGPPEGAHFIIRLKKTPSAIRLEIEDNGPGMSEEIRKRIFEPFYTTKGIGQGTGLGLSVAYFIITENHKGRFTVDSAPGRGTNFIIELPLTEDET